MASRLPLHSQLSSIMETMARSVLAQVCKLVDEDSTELRLELSRLLAANSTLTEKVNSLECELTVARSDAAKLCKSYHSVGVQTVCCGEGDADGNLHLFHSNSSSDDLNTSHQHCICVNWCVFPLYSHCSTFPQCLDLPPSRGSLEKIGV